MLQHSLTQLREEHQLLRVHVLVVARQHAASPPRVRAPHNGYPPNLASWEGVMASRAVSAIVAASGAHSGPCVCCCLRSSSCRLGAACLGVAAMPPFSVARELAEGSLVRVLPSWRPIHDLGIFAVTPHRTMLPARVHVVLEAVRAQVAELVPVWEEMTR